MSRVGSQKFLHWQRKSIHGGFAFAITEDLRFNMDKESPLMIDTRHDVQKLEEELARVQGEVKRQTSFLKLMEEEMKSLRDNVTSAIRPWKIEDGEKIYKGEDHGAAGSSSRNTRPKKAKTKKVFDEAMATHQLPTNIKAQK